MLLLALILPPLAAYLLVLAWVNRRSRPVFMAGPWEFAGVLFALSGFLLAGGPALLGSFDEQSRSYWLLGETESPRASSAGAETQLGRPGAAEFGEAQAARSWPTRTWTATLWIAVRVLYIVAVAGGAAFFLWRSRRLTSIYNVDAQALFAALEQALTRLDGKSLRSGHSFVIGGRALENAEATAPKPVPANTTLRVDAFPPMRHVTLRWAPADSPIRSEVEQELTRLLAAAGPEPETLHGGCLSLVGVLLFTVALVAAGLLILYRVYPPR